MNLSDLEKFSLGRCVAADTGPGGGRCERAAVRTTAYNQTVCADCYRLFERCCELAGLAARKHGIVNRVAPPGVRNN